MSKMKISLLSLLLIICLFNGLFNGSTGQATPIIKPPEITDTTEFGSYLDIKKVTIYDAFGDITLNVTYDGILPNHPQSRRYTSFGIDLDQDSSSGGSWHHDGLEYVINIAEGRDNFIEFFTWNPSTSQFEGSYQPELRIIGAPNTNYFGLTFPYSLLGLTPGQSFDLYVTGFNGVYNNDNLSFTYKFGKDTNIEVGGKSSDWKGVTPVLTSPSGEVKPSEFDWTKFYITDDSAALYGRLDVASNPTIGRIPDFRLSRGLHFFIDTDNNDQTGVDEFIYRGVEFRAYVGYATDAWGKNSWIDTAVWDEASSQWIWSWDINRVPLPDYYEESAFSSTFEWVIPTSQDWLNLKPGQTIKVYISELQFEAEDRVPNEGLGSITYTVSTNEVHEIETATGSGTAKLTSSAGTMTDIIAVSEDDLPAAGKPSGVVFPHGLFSFTITDLTPGQMVRVSLMLPSNVPAGTSYWKYQEGVGWYSIPMGSNDGDKVIFINLTDGGLGDADGLVNGVIVDPGAPAFSSAPVLNPIGDKWVDETNTLSFTVTATDYSIPSQNLEFSLVGAPNGAEIDPNTGDFWWTPSEAQGSSSFTFKFVVSDGELTDEETITVHVNDVNARPDLASVSPKIIAVGTELLVDLEANDPDIPVNTLTFSIIDSPSGATIDPHSGVLRWTPSASQGTGLYSFTVRVTDNGVPPLYDDTIITVVVTEQVIQSLFNDGFESGSFSAWTGTYATGGETKSVTTYRAHEGTHSAVFESNNGGGTEKAYAYTNISPSGDVHVQGCFLVSKNGLIDNYDRFQLISLRSGDNTVAYAGWYKTSSGIRWFLSLSTSGGWVTSYSRTAPSTGQWYMVKLHWKNGVSDGVGELYVNDVKVCSLTNKNTSRYGDVNRVRMGLPELINCGSTRVYLDCVNIMTITMKQPQIVRIGYIAASTSGLETEGPFMEQIVERDLNQYAADNGYNTLFDIIVEDAAEQSSVHLEKVQQFHAQGIDLIIGGLWSSQAAGSLNYVNSNNMLLFSPSSTSPTLSIANDRFFRMCSSDASLTPTLVDMMWNYGIKSVIIIQRGDSWGDGIVNIFKPMWEAKGGQFAGEVIRYNIEAGDFNNYLQLADEQCIAAKAAVGDEHVGVLDLSFDESATIALQAEGYTNVYNVPWFGADGTAMSWRLSTETPVQAVHLQFLSLIATSPDSPEYLDLAARYQALVNQQFTTYTAYRYDIAMVLAKAIFKTSSTDASIIASALPGICANHYGTTGWCTLNEYGDRVPPPFMITTYHTNASGVPTDPAEFAIVGSADGVTHEVSWDLDELGYTPPGQ